MRLPVGKGRHAPIGAEDRGRDHDQMAAELTEALGRKIVFENVSIYAYSKSLETMGIPPYVIQHFEGTMDAYQHGVMGAMNDNLERLTG